jgi:hypothetical protein
MPATDVSRAELWFDPARVPTADDHELHLIIVETACASGATPEGRILAPRVVYGPDAVLIEVTVRHRPGGQDCQGNPEHPLTIPLSERLGDRQVRDASVLPPKLVEPWKTHP